MHLLIAEDEKNIANSLRKNLIEEGHNAVIANDGEKALELLEENSFDVVLLDWRMPKVSGIEVLKNLRSTDSNTPVILITALSDISNKVEALKLGADDYITKPFSFEEVLARIEALRRRYRNSQNILEIGDLSIDLIARTVESGETKVRLTEKEFELLKYLTENKEVILSKDELCREVWDLNFSPNTNLVEVTIKNLRKKLEELTDKKYIKTIYGEGFILIEE